MSDIKKIDTSYYGTKEEWLNIPGRLSDTYKAPSFGTLQNAYDTGKLELNKRLNSSFHMFGIKGESDFLYPCSMIYDRDSGYKLIRKKIDTTEIAYFSGGNISYNSEGIIWKEGNNSSYNNKMINGTGLKDIVTYPDLNSRIYPLIDFNYNFLCAVIKLHIIKQSEETKTIETTIDFDTFFDNIETTYAGYKIVGYSFNIVSGNNTDTRVGNYPIIFGSVNTNYPENELITYPVFSYQPRYGLWGGGIFKTLSYSVSSANRDFEICFYANPKYWEIEEFNYGGSYYCPVFKGSKEDLLSLCSYIGIHFTGNSTSALSSKLGENITDEKIYFEPGEKLGEDVDVWYRIALKHPIAISTKMTTLYRREYSTATVVTSNATDWCFAKRQQSILNDIDITRNVKESYKAICDRYYLTISREYCFNHSKKDAYKWMKKVSSKISIRYFVSLLLCVTPSFILDIFPEGLRK